MTLNPTPALSGTDLNDIRDAVPSLDLQAIRSLRRAGFQIVRDENEPHTPAAPAWTHSVSNAA